MTKKEHLERFKANLKKMEDIAIRKNSDYCGADAGADPFKNFKLVEQLGVTDAARGILVRMCDKMSRISSLLDSEAQVKDESVEDTLLDLANYSLILINVRAGSAAPAPQTAKKLPCVGDMVRIIAGGYSEIPTGTVGRILVRSGSMFLVESPSGPKIGPNKECSAYVYDRDIEVVE